MIYNLKKVSLSKEDEWQREAQRETKWCRSRPTPTAISSPITSLSIHLYHIIPFCFIREYGPPFHMGSHFSAKTKHLFLYIWRISYQNSWMVKYFSLYMENLEPKLVNGQVFFVNCHSLVSIMLNHMLGIVIETLTTS